MSESVCVCVCGRGVLGGVRACEGACVRFAFYFVFFFLLLLLLVLFNFFCNKSFDFSQPRLTCLPDVSHSSKNQLMFLLR